MSWWNKYLPMGKVDTPATIPIAIKQLGIGTGRVILVNKLKGTSMTLQAILEAPNGLVTKSTITRSVPSNKIAAHYEGFYALKDSYKSGSLFLLTGNKRKLIASF